MLQNLWQLGTLQGMVPVCRPLTGISLNTSPFRSAFSVVLDAFPELLTTQEMCWCQNQSVCSTGNLLEQSDWLEPLCLVPMKHVPLTAPLSVLRGLNCYATVTRFLAATSSSSQNLSRKYQCALGWLGLSWLCGLWTTATYSCCGDQHCQLNWNRELNSYCLLFDTGFFILELN